MKDFARAFYAAGRAASGAQPTDRKGICDHCKKPVEVRVNEAWHTKGDKVWHEICSYQQQIEELSAMLAAPAGPAKGLSELRELSEKAASGNCGQWELYEDTCRRCREEDATEWGINGVNRGHHAMFAGKENAEFIVACVNYVRALLHPAGKSGEERKV